jgi:hypothetical protein
VGWRCVRNHEESHPLVAASVFHLTIRPERRFRAERGMAERLVAASRSTLKRRWHTRKHPWNKAPKWGTSGLCVSGASNGAAVPSVSVKRERSLGAEDDATNPKTLRAT